MTVVDPQSASQFVKDVSSFINMTEDFLDALASPYLVRGVFPVPRPLAKRLTEGLVRCGADPKGILRVMHFAGASMDESVEKTEMNEIEPNPLETIGPIWPDIKVQLQEAALQVERGNVSNEDLV